MTLPEAVHKLTQNWVLVLTPKEAGEYKAQDFPPLLHTLQHLVAPNSGRTRGGANDPSARSVVDVKALDLLMHIQDVVQSRLAAWRITSTGLITDMLAYHSKLESLWTSAAITETEYLRFTGYPEVWARRIWELVEPPARVPLREATCPRCGRAKWVNDDGDTEDALIVSYRDGGDVQAECRWRNCDYLAVGTRALLELGFHVGAQVDDDVLREMGVIV